MKISLLGGLAVSEGGRQLDFETRKAASLFAFLTLHQDRRVPREKLVGALWADWDDERAHRNLNTALWRVRKALEGSSDVKLETSRADVKLGFGLSEVRIDVEDFRQAVDLANRTTGDDRLRHLEEAEVLYAGDFLEGFEDEWCGEERRALNELHINVLGKLASAYQEAGDLQKSLDRFQRLVELEPLDENAHRNLMLIHYLSGNHSAALRQFEFLKRTLTKELGVQPSESTVELWEHIRGRDGAKLSESKDPKLGLRHNRLFNVPLIGRMEQFNDLLASLEAARGGAGSAFVIIGDVGIGKTKLAETVSVEAKLRGFEVLRGCCSELESSTPYHAFIQALWPRLTRRQSSPSWLASLADRLVQLSLSKTAVNDAQSLPIYLDSAIVHESLLSFLTPASSRSATLLILEDLHTVDRATEGLLCALLPRIDKLPLVLLLTVRCSEPRWNETVELLVSGGAERIELGPLPRDDMRRLVQTALDADSISDRLADFVWSYSSGVPLIALEVLKFMEAQGWLRSGKRGTIDADGHVLTGEFPSYPSRIAETIRRRILLLDQQAVTVLCLAAVLGSAARFEHLEELADIPEDRFIEVVERLVEARLLQETENGLRFPHQTNRLAALTLLGRARLRRLHRKVAALFERVAPAMAEEIAWHYEQAGELMKASTYYEASGDRARAIHANTDAVERYTKGLDLLASELNASGAGLRRQVGLLKKRQEALDLVGRRSEQLGDLEKLSLIASTLGDRSLLAESAYLSSQVLSRMNLNAQALNAAKQAAYLFHSIGDATGEARAHESIGTVHINSRNQRQAARACRLALKISRRARSRSTEARALIQLATAISFDGRNLQAIKHLEKAEGILREIGDKRSLAVALIQKGVLLRFVGRNRLSEAYLSSGIAIFQEIGDRIGKARGLTQLAITHVALGQLRDGLRESLMAINLARESGDVRAQIMCLNNMADVFRCIGDFRRGEYCVAQAIKRVTAAGGAENLAIYYDTMASLLVDKGDNKGAVRCAKHAQTLFRTWEGHFRYVGTEIDFRLGLAYLRLGRYSRAHPLLVNAIEASRKDPDFSLQVHGVAALGQLHLEQGDVRGAVECARDLDKLLRRADGLDQVQKAYWIQYRIYKETGSHLAARKALKRATQAVMEQASTLRGRLRRRFLEAVGVNREILAEVPSAKGTFYSDIWSARQPIQPYVLSSQGSVSRIEERRRTLLGLLGNASIRQKEIAAQLGVSVRTVRYDLSALRQQGLLPQRPIQVATT